MPRQTRRRPKAGAGYALRTSPILLIAPTRPEYVTIRGAVVDLVDAGVVQLVLCGIGLERATALCRRLESAGWNGRLILLGWAGGLSPDLAAGDIVVADATVNCHGDCIDLAPLEVAGARIGALLSVPAPLSTPQDKRNAAKSGALAVEMEAYPLAAWAAARGIPFAHARVILDPVDEALPDLADALDAFGGVLPLRLARWCLTRPQEVPNLLGLARRVRQLGPGLRVLARAVAAPASRQA